MRRPGAPQDSRPRPRDTRPRFERAPQRRFSFARTSSGRWWRCRWYFRRNHFGACIFQAPLAQLRSRRALRRSASIRSVVSFRAASFAQQERGARDTVGVRCRRLPASMRFPREPPLCCGSLAPRAMSRRERRARRSFFPILLPIICSSPMPVAKAGSWPAGSFRLRRVRWAAP